MYCEENRVLSRQLVTPFANSPSVIWFESRNADFRSNNFTVNWTLNFRALRIIHCPLSPHPLSIILFLFFPGPFNIIFVYDKPETSFVQLEWKVDDLNENEGALWKKEKYIKFIIVFGYIFIYLIHEQIYKFVISKFIFFLFIWKNFITIFFFTKYLY